MEHAALFCLPWIDVCRTMADWKDFTGIVTALVGVPAAVIAAYRALREYRKATIQREEELRLRRTEFTLAQHRRLFDDTVLSSVLQLIDGDDSRLAAHEMWDPKRKFLTFIEELMLLIRAKYVSEPVAFYMFGYYAVAAHDGLHFREGIDWDARYWGLFFEFVEKAREFMDRPEVPITELAL